MEIVDTLERAVGMIEKEMKKGGSGVINALKAMVDAQSLSTADGAKLAAIFQSTQSTDDLDTGAPAAAAAYENQSGGVLDVLNDFLEKAQGELEKASNHETADIPCQGTATALTGGDAGFL